MKYLFLHCTAALYGASRMMLRTINKLVEDNHSVHVVLPYSGPLVDALKNTNVSVIDQFSVGQSLRVDIKSASPHGLKAIFDG